MNLQVCNIKNQDCSCCMTYTLIKTAIKKLESIFSIPLSHEFQRIDMFEMLPDGSNLHLDSNQSGSKSTRCYNFV